MKKCLLSLVVACFLVFSCSSPSVPSNASTPTSKAGNGTLTVAFPQSSSRSLSLGTAESTSNYFQVIAYNATGQYAGSTTTISGTVSLSIPVGTYSILALAGVYYPGITQYYLLGSGLTTGVAVVAGQSATATVTLTNTTFQVTAPASLVPTVGTSFTFYATGDFGTSVLSLGGNNYWFGRSSSTTSSNITSVNDSGKTGSSFGATYTVPANASTGSEDIYGQCGIGLYLTDAGYGVNKQISQITGGGNWYFPMLGTTTSNNVLVFVLPWTMAVTDSTWINEFSFTVDWMASSSASGVGLVWGTPNTRI